MPKENDLQNSIDRLREVQEKNLSLGSNFVRGIVSGFGFFIGSAILLSLIIYFLQFFNTAPVVGRYFNAVLIEVQRLQKK